MKEFIKDYILSQVEQTERDNKINILNQTEQTSENFGYSYVQCGEYIVFYENSTNGTGMNFYVYDKSMTLIKTENLTDNWIAIVGQTLKQDENGNFYLLGYMNPEETEQGTTYYSLILLNNIITDTPIIRKWYKLSNIGITYAFDCQKREGSADYLFIYENSRTVSGSAVYDLCFTQFTISVQNGNSTIKWVYQNYSSSRFATLNGVGYQYNQDASKILILRRLDQSIKVIRVNLDNDYDITTTNQLTTNNGIEVNTIIEDTVGGITQNKKIIVNSISNFVYISDETSKLVQYNIIDNYTTPIAVNITEETVIDYIFNQSYIGFITGEEGNYTITLHKYELTENSILISNNKLIFQTDFQWNITQYLLNLNLIDTQIYNLSYISLILVEVAGNGTAIIVLTDNSIPEYKDYNSLVPDYVNLYNGNVLFSRELTNKSIIGNQMSAEVNVPYSMLNRTISVEKLISKTFKELSNESKIINKNIYESLYLNFIKHINVIDNNFEKNELQNDISSLLTKSIFSLPEENYNKAPIGYAKIFTKDEQELIFSIGQNAIEQIGDYEYQISIAVNGNNADKLQILAKDRQTPYVTIPLHAVNKVILIKQTIRIEEG